MSDSMTIEEEGMLSPEPCPTTKGLNLSKEFGDPEVSDPYKNNNNNIEDSSISSPPGRDVAYSETNLTKRHVSESSSDECKMNISPKREQERALAQEEDERNMQYSPKGSRSLDGAGDSNNGKYPPEADYLHHHHSLGSLQKRIFSTIPEEREREHRHQQEYGRDQSFESRLKEEQSNMAHNFIGGELTEDMSDNEMMCDDYESDSDANEPRITVREALMNRALAAAAAAAAAGSTSHFQERSGERDFSAETGGSGRTSLSPSSSPGVRSTSTSGIASGRTENSSNSSVSKEPFVNGHVGHSIRPVTHSERYHQQSHRSFGAHHGQHGQSHGGSKPNQHRELSGKSESKSHPVSPHQTEGMKPENLALSNLSNIQSSIGNALFNLASLGSLAALQQSLPGLLSSVGGNGPTSPSRTSPHSGSGGGATSSPSIHNAPLNLTHSSGGSTTTPKSHSHAGSNSNHSRTHSSIPSVPNFSHQSPYSHNTGGNQNLMLGGGGGGLIPPNLAAYFSQSAAGGGSSSSPSPSPFIPNSNQLSSLSHAAGNMQPGSLPQLVLASGQIMQGIQGAQLLIPTSQGIMTQMILTIPLTQPGSPTPTQNTSPAIGSASGQRSSSPHSRSARGHARGHHGLPQCSANSPPIASTVPPSASPDYSGPGGMMPSSLLNLSPHLVNQSLGAHIPLDKMGMDRVPGMNGVRPGSVKRDNTGSVISPNPNLPMSALYPPKMSPCSNESDKCSEAGDSDQMVDGINLDEIKEFAKAFKLRRLSLGLTQTQVGQALSVTEGPAYSQSAICSALAWQLAQSQSQLSQSNRTSLPQSSMFEKLDITPKSAQKIKPVLERWMKEAEDRYKNGHQNLNEFVGMEPSKKRKRRTSFTPQALEILNTQFERNTHPSGAEITTLAHQLGYEREVIRIWFCNKRQALKNTVRMMSKGSSPI